MTSPIIRASSLPSWFDCPRRAAARSFGKQLKEIGYEFRSSVRSVSSAIGTAVHSGTGHALKNKITEQDTPLKDTIDIGIESYKKETQDGVEYDATTDTRNTAEKQIINITTVYYNQVLPNRHPIAVENELTGKAKGLEISGHADEIETLVVNDTKTGADGQTYQEQGGTYILLAKANGIATPDIFGVDHIPRSTIKKPQPNAVRYEYSADLCVQMAKDAITEVSRQWFLFDETNNPGVFPINKMSNMCSAKYCTAWGTDWCPVSKTFK